METTKTNANTIHILSAEDNEAQQYLISKALKESSEKYTLVFVDNGEDAISYLRNENQYVNAPRPHLVLLDINLPRKSGTEVLREIREDETLRHIPVLMLSSSTSEEDKLKCHSLHAEAFVSKPADLDGYGIVIEAIEKVCAKLGHSDRGALERDLLKSSLKTERAARQLERRELLEKIQELDRRIAAQDTKIRELEEGIKGELTDTSKPK